ncbi:MAG TPA: LuxR C-terminal-related transcriptional regulator [Steroidobacteraceae bacterium]|nr:LuxR C-terminal-related transcriptional regulator [Steroidobacteraceae bacterium]
MDDRLKLGRDRYDQRAWAGAYEALAAVRDAEGLPPDDMERLYTAAYLSGRDREFLRTLECLFSEQADSPQYWCRAARAAFWLAFAYQFYGQAAQSNAWEARGRRLVGDRDCVERGYLLLPGAELRLRSRDNDAASALTAEAVAIGREFRDADLTAAALHMQGRALIAQGQVRAGLRDIDEAMLGVVAGELGPIMTGLLYCSVIECCRDIRALDRSREWTAAFSRHCDSQPEMLAYAGSCYVHRSEILQFHGAWTDAITEARRACDRAQLSERDPPGAARYQEAEIHRLRGEFAKAEAGYRAASLLGCEPQPGLALLRLAQGRVDAASASMRRLLVVAGDRVKRARFLPDAVEVLAAAGESDEARRLCVELKELAESFDSEVLRAACELAEGQVALADGEAERAQRALQASFDRWERLAAPYDAARARVLLGLACRALGDHDSCALALEAARAAFVRLEARHDIERLDSFADRESGESGHVLTVRELEVLRLVAAGHPNKDIARTLGLSGRTVDRHVSNILCKLQVTTRTAATAYAFARKLI